MRKRIRFSIHEKVCDVVPPKTITYNSTWKCPKCGTTQIIHWDYVGPRYP